MLQQFEKFLTVQNDIGIIISDNTDGKKIYNLVRKMRIYNPILSNLSGQRNNEPTKNIIEDIFLRDSENSYFIQTVDDVSHLLYRKEYPKGSLKKYNLQNQFELLEPILLKEESLNDGFGIVRK